MLFLLCGLFILPHTLAVPSEAETLIQEQCAPLLNNRICNLECPEEFEAKGDCIMYPVNVTIRNLTICFPSVPSRQESNFAATLLSIALHSKVRTIRYIENNPKCFKFFVDQEASVSQEDFAMEATQLEQDIFEKLVEYNRIRQDYDSPAGGLPIWVCILGAVFLVVGFLAVITYNLEERTRKRRIVSVKGNWNIPLENEIHGIEAKRPRLNQRLPLTESEYESTTSQESTPHRSPYNYQYLGQSYRCPVTDYSYNTPRQDAYGYACIQSGPQRPRPEMLPPLPATPGYNPRHIPVQFHGHSDQMSVADTYSSPLMPRQGPATNHLFTQAMRGEISLPINSLEVNASVQGVFPIHAVVRRPFHNGAPTALEVDQMISDLGKVLDAGANINQKTRTVAVYNPDNAVKDEETALMIAVTRGLHRVASFLLSRGACQWQIHRFNSNCMHEAVKNEDVAMLKLLLEHHVKDPRRDEAMDNLPKIEGVDFCNRTPLMCCALACSGAQMAQFLIEMGGADVNSTGNQDSINYNGRTVLHLAVVNNNMPLLDYLLNLENIDLDVQDIAGRTAVFLCCFGGKGDALKKLLDRGASHIKPAHQYAAAQYKISTPRALKRSKGDNSFRSPRDAAMNSDITQILDNHERRKMKRRSDPPPAPQSPVIPRAPRASSVGIASLPQESPYHTPSSVMFESRTGNQHQLASVNIDMPQDANDYVPNTVENDHYTRYNL